MGRRPTHRLVIKQRDGKLQTFAGVGWQNEQGWISINLNPAIVLDFKDQHYISLYPIRYDEAPTGQNQPYSGEDDEPPF